MAQRAVLKNAPMQIYDISVALGKTMPTWPGANNAIVHTYTSKMSNNGARNVSNLQMSLHAGTHIDAPYHCVEDGITCDKIPLNKLMGRAVVYDMTNVSGAIDVHHLASLDISNDRACLFKTVNSGLWALDSFNEQFVTISYAAAEHIAAIKVPLVGIDYMSVDSFNDDTSSVHKALFKSGIVILEGINLSAVPAGEYNIMCLPLKILGSEAAPVRAILTK